MSPASNKTLDRKVGKKTRVFYLLAVTNTAWQREKAAGGNSSDLYSEMAPHSGHSSQPFLDAHHGNAHSVPNDA